MAPGPTAPHPRPGRGSPATVRRVAAAAFLAWGLLAVSAVAVGDAGTIARTAGVLLTVVVAVAMARWRPLRLASAVALAAYAAGLTAATLVGGAALAAGGDAERVALFTGNPNVLGAALVTAMAAWAAVAPQRRWVWWAWPIVALAVLNTGSRTSGGALLVAGTVWLVAQAVRVRRRLLVAPLLALLVLAAAAFAWQRLVVELTPNLLAAPSDLRHPAWTSLADHLEVIDDATPGPFEGTMAQRLVAQAASGRRHVVYQSIGRSEAGVPYVASVYLRADEPQRVQLTSHLARVACEVDATWRRCVTPVGYGDDRAQRQIHLQADQRGGRVDVYVFGAQYERGTEATPFLDARPAWVPQSMVNRYDLRRITFLPENRVTLWAAGLDIARDHPWFGVGRAASADAFRARSGTSSTYAHHLLIELLAVHGAVGFLGAALFVVALLSVLARAGWVRLAPLLVGLVLLNTWDVTLFAWPVFVPAVLAVSHGVGSTVAPSEDPDRASKPQTS